MKVAKQSGVNKVTADYLWKTKRIHLCSFNGELFLACPNKVSEEWARENYPHLGIWDEQQIAYAWDAGYGYHVVEDAKSARDAAVKYYGDHPDEWEEGISIDVHKVKKEDPEKFLCINAYDDLVDKFYDHYEDDSGQLDGVDQDDLNNFVAKKIVEYLTEKKVDLNFWHTFGQEINFQASDFKYEDLWRKSGSVE